MRILMISPDLNYPPIYGGRIRRYNLLKYLSRDNDFTLLSFVNSKEDFKNTEGIKKYCKAVETVQLGSHSGKDYWITRFRNYFLSKFFSYPPIVIHFYSREMKRRIKKVIAENDYDLVLIEYWYMGQYANCIKGIIKVLDKHDIEYMRWYGLYEFCKDQKTLSLHKRIKKHELRVLKRFDKILTVTQTDKDFLLEKYNSALDISVVPSGVDTSYFKLQEKSNDSKNLVFVGSLAHAPNVDGILYFCREMLPLILKKIPETHLFIVGLCPSKDVLNLGNNNITVTGFVKDIRPYVYKSSVFVVPLRFGTGIRGKILEAMALGKPVIATSIAATGLEVTPDQDIIIADDPKDFAFRTIELLNNRALRNRLIENGWRLINEKYRWEKIISELERVLYEVVNIRGDGE